MAELSDFLNPLIGSLANTWYNSTSAFPTLTMSTSEDIGLAHNVEITKILLYNHMGEVLNIRELMVEMTILNSMFEPGIHGSILVQDTHSLLTRLPIIGEERIEIEFYTPGNAIKFFRGLVYTVTDIMPDSKGAKTSYVIRFCSEEIFQNAAVHVAKAYTNTLTANLIIEDIMKAYLGIQKPIFVDPCREIQKTLIIPYMHPYDAIDFLRNRVKGTNDTDPHYFEFFERFDGVYFKNVPNMVAGKLNKSYNTYQYYSDKFSNQRDLGQDMFRIISLKINSKFDTIDKINEGMFNNENFEYSFDDKQIYSDVKDYKDFKPFLGTSRMNTDAFVDKYTQNIAKGMNGSMTTFKERRVDQNFQLPKPGGMHLMNRLSLNQISVTITVPGDSTVDIGDIVQLIIPEFDADPTEVGTDEHLSGLYIVGSMRNFFLTPDKHTMQLDLYRDGFTMDITGMSDKLRENIQK